MKHAINLGLTPGKEDGVGPELLLKSIHRHNSLDNINYIWCGDFSSIKLAAQNAHLALDFLSEEQALLENKLLISFLPSIKETCGIKRQAIFLEESVRLALSDEIDALLTGPIEKAALAHLKHNGQTEYFAEHLGQPRQKTMMTFMGGPFILSLLTTHLPLKEVSSRITKESLKDHLKSLARICAQITGKKSPKIAVLGLNPHAGENGLLGDEEEEIIKPVLNELKGDFDIYGPLPADGFFAYFHKSPLDFDVVVAMYHDQGLIPYKLLCEGKAVNATLGLKIPRVSPAHGTAIELTGKNLACSLSTEKALELAIKLAQINLRAQPDLIT